MKTEKPTIQDIERMLGVRLPEAPEGYSWEWLGLTTTKTNDRFFDGTAWTKAHFNFTKNTGCLTIRPIRTHREDGTPMDIDPLPELSDYRSKYVRGSELIEQEQYDLSYVWNGGEWTSTQNATFVVQDDDHYALLYKIQQPTTLKDLYPTGSENVWLIHKDGEVSLARSVDRLPDKRIVIEDYSMKQCAELARWSHSPHTSYEDANEFVVEGGGE